MFADDRPAAPMTFFLRFGFSGQLDVELFKDAVWQAQQRHSFFRRVISGSSLSTTDELAWRLADQPRCHIGVSQADAAFPDFPEGRTSIDITQEVGLRFFLQMGDDDDLTVLAQVHHCASDALGAISMIDDVLLAYDALALGNSAPQFRPLDETLFDMRGAAIADHALSSDEPNNELGAMIKTLTSPSEPIEGPEPGEHWTSGALDPFPASTTAALSANQSATLVARAAGAGTTVNDVLLHDLFLALDACYGRNDQIRVGRVAMPVDLRTPELAAMPAANAVGIAFLDWTLSETRSRPSLLQAISARTRALKDRSSAAQFCQALELAGRFKRGLSRFTSPDHCFCTTLLSNLIRPFGDSSLLGDDGLVRAGNLTMTSCEFLPPIRPATSAAFGVATYAGSTHVTLNFDSRVMSRDAADRLLDAFTGKRWPSTLEG
jgi:hypothetical protein